MSNVKLPKPLQDYIVVDEHGCTGDARQGQLLFMYVDDQRAETLRYPWKISGSYEAELKPRGGFELFIQRKKDLFARHIENRFLREQGKILVADAEAEMPRLVDPE